MWIMIKEKIVELLHLKSVGRRVNDWRGREMLDVVGVESMPKCNAIIRKWKKKKITISTIIMIVISTMHLAQEVNDCVDL